MYAHWSSHCLPSKDPIIIVVDYVLRKAVDGHEHLGLTLTEGHTSRLPRKVNLAIT